MLCTECKKRLATVHLKALVGNQLVEYFLCADCAEQKGLEIAGQASPLATFLGLLSSLAARRADAARCPGCHATWDRFQKSGRLGCARCYESFAVPLSKVLAKVHGADRHAGRRPPAPPGPEDLESLRGKLRAAVEREDFETAARLHERIRRHEGS